jgi:hypothetical protein
MTGRTIYRQAPLKSDPPLLRGALPNTIVAGAQKSGTTALCRFIDSHPDCLVSRPKEPNFFSRAENVKDIEKYRRCFRGTEARHRVLLDGTTTYMADPAIAPRIRECLGGDIKIIFILRSPAARTYSSFLHMVKRGHERRTADEVFLGLPDDPKAAAADEAEAVVQAAAQGRVIRRPYQKLYDDVLWNFRYIGNSLYGTLVEDYFAVFRRENILILFFEDVVNDVDATRQALGRFLGIRADLFPESMAKDNPTKVPNISSPIGWLTEQARWIKRSNFTLVRPSEIAASPLAPSGEVAEKFRAIFAAEVDRWSERTGRDLRAIGW